MIVIAPIWRQRDQLKPRTLAYVLDVLGLQESILGFNLALEPGVYIGLPEEIYFLQRALGTTDLARLWLYREGWWWQSANNPHKVLITWDGKAKDTTKAKLFGSAAHALLLEGEEAFNERFAVEPDPAMYPDLLVTQDQIASALRESDAPAGFERMKKADQVELAKVYLPDRHIWDVILARHRRTAKTRDSITVEERWQLDVMLGAAMNDPDMAAVVAASGGVRLTELSVLWLTDDGIMLRFRFDSLLPQINADLKTLGNARDRDLGKAVGAAIANGALDVQAAQSFEARRHAYDFVVAGRVFGGTAEQLAHIRQFPTRAPLDMGDRPGWSWFWMFYQKADNDGRAPIIFPLHMPFGCPQHVDGWRKALHALAFYRHQVATVGLAKPWTRVERIHTMDPADRSRPQVQLPFWADQPMTIAGEQAGLNWRDHDG